MTPARIRWWLWAAVVFLGAVTLALSVVVLRAYVFPPPPVVFEQMTVATPQVQPGGTLEVRLVASYRNLDCFSGATRIMRFADGSELRATGTRQAVSDERPERQSVVHRIAVPVGVARGPATVQIRDVFTCGPSPVDSPVRSFRVVDGPAK